MLSHLSISGSPKDQSLKGCHLRKFSFDIAPLKKSFVGLRKRKVPMATFLQHLRPLVVAAQKYAEAMKAYKHKSDSSDETLHLLLLAKDDLAEAAIEFAKWGKK